MRLWGVPYFGARTALHRISLLLPGLSAPQRELLAVQAFYDVEQVETISGPSQTFERVGASGKKVVYDFCAVCGTTLYWKPGFRPGKIAIAAGAFADQAFPPPERLVWTDFRHPWIQVPDETTQYSANAP